MVIPKHGYALFALLIPLGVAAFFISTNFVIAAEPASDVIKTKLTDTLKSISANVSNAVLDTVDKMISITTDVIIEDAMENLENATIYGNKDTSSIKFEPKHPSGIALPQVT